MKNIFKISINYFVIINIIFSFVLPITAFAQTNKDQITSLNTESINSLLNDNQIENNVDPEISSDPNYESWLKNVQNQIQNEEYNTYFLEDVDKYLFNNRKQNLKSYIDSNFWTLKDRDENLDWFWTYNLDNLNREGNNYIYFNKNKERNIEAKNNLISVDKNILTEWYKNTEQGIEQGFTIKEKISGEGILKLEANIDTNLKLKSESKTKIVFSNDNKEIEFSHLKVFDANDNILDAYFDYDKKENNLTIVVDDSQAVYPITIDPIASSASWTAEGEFDGDNFGYSVSTAGDVNGDGYSDVIIGATFFDVEGLTNAGKVYVYYGSSTGLSDTADWTAEGDQINANFGRFVSLAGDVNGDGYSDVMIGSSKYDIGELADAGKVWVYYGSSTGLSDTADWTAEGDQASGYFGFSVSSAGDVNGDGYSDIIIGTYTYDIGELVDAGKVYVYYGSSTGLSDTADWTAEGDQASGYLGYSVSSAGDVNGDGYSDVIISAWFYDNEEVNSGKVYVYYGSSTGLSDTADWTAEGDQASGYLGYSVSSAGDVNGDGYSDIIIGTYTYDIGELVDAGKVYVYYGSSTGLSDTADWTAEGDQASGYLGYSVSSAGDVNGDGYSDVIIGSSKYDVGELTNNGKVYVYYGGANDLSATASWTAEGEQSNDYFTYSVSSAGDVNGDGYSDVIASSPYYDSGDLTNAGKVYVYYGSSTGLSSTADWTVEGDQANGNLGFCISLTGDVNGDGYDDITAVAYNYDVGELTDAGKVYVYYGSSTGLSSTADWTVEGDQVSAKIGSKISSAGDINGDGYNEIVVSSYLYDIGGLTNAGKVYVYYGSSTGLSSTADWTVEGDQNNGSLGYRVSNTGDVNGDGYGDVVLSSFVYDIDGMTDAGKVWVYYGSSTGLSTSADWTAVGEGSGDYLGSGISTAGDVNGDGYSDMIIGASNYDVGELTDAGKVYVYYGSSTGLSSTADWTVEGDQSNGWFGNNVSSVGDINSDGYSDILVSTHNYTIGELAKAGKVWIYYGSSTGLSSTADWTVEGDQSNGYLGLSALFAGDVNGDGYSDILINAPYYDAGELTNNGKVYVYYGNQGGISKNYKQLNSENNLIPVLGWTDITSGFKITAKAKAFTGRSNAKLQYEVKQYGTAFTGTSLSESSSWTDTGVSGVTLTETVTGLYGGLQYHWRARLLYNDGLIKYFTPWFSASQNSWTEASLRTYPYTLVYTAGANGTLTGTTTQLINYNEDATAITAVPNTNYHFVNWSDESTDNPRTDTNIDSDLSLTANFSIDTFSVSYTAGANGTLSGDSSQTIDYGSDATTITAVPNATYHFVNWSDGLTTNPRTDTNITSTISVTANFAINDQGGTFMPVPAPVRIKNGTEKLTNSDIEIDNCKINFSNLENIKSIAISKTEDFKNSNWDKVSGDSYNLLGDYIGNYYIKFNSIDGISTDVLEVNLNCSENNQIKHEHLLEGPIISENNNICTQKYFNYNFTIGNSGLDVKDLQVFLNNNGFVLTNNGYGAPGNETEYFGSLTQNAFYRYKESCNDQNLKKENVEEQKQEGCQINNYLYIGSTGEEVRCLQEKLKKLNYFTFPSITSYFGPVTKEAVVNFQKYNNLIPYPGWVGPGTRDVLNSL